MGLIGVLSELALTCLSANVYGENPADVCLDWIHLFSCQCLWGWIQSMSAKGFSGVFCQICLLFCQVLFRRNLLVSAWTELACLQYLPGELTQCLLEVSPTACLSVSSGGLLGFLLRRASRRFLCLLPSVSKQSYPQELRSFSHSVSLSVWVFPLFWWSWYPIFFSLWRMPTGCLPLGLPRFCFKTYQIFFWSSLTLIFYQDCTSATTCK